METYKYLSGEERTMIQLSFNRPANYGQLSVACSAPSSISREWQRNGWSPPTAKPRGPGRLPVAGVYRAPIAPQRAKRLAATARFPARLDQQGPLWAHVQSLLREHTIRNRSQAYCMT